MLLRPPHSKLCLMSWPHVYLFFNVAFSLFTVTRLFPAWPWVWIVQLASMHTGAWLVSHRGQLVKGSRRSCHTAEINKFQGKEGPVGCHFWKLPFQVGFKVPLAEVLFFSIIDPLAINLYSWKFQFMSATSFQWLFHKKKCDKSHGPRPPQSSSWKQMSISHPLLERMRHQNPLLRPG